MVSLSDYIAKDREGTYFQRPKSNILTIIDGNMSIEEEPFAMSFQLKEKVNEVSILFNPYFNLIHEQMQQSFYFKNDSLILNGKAPVQKDKIDEEKSAKRFTRVL